MNSMLADTTDQNGPGRGLSGQAGQRQPRRQSRGHAGLNIRLSHLRRPFRLRAGREYRVHDWPCWRNAMIGARDTRVRAVVKQWKWTASAMAGVFALWRKHRQSSSGATHEAALLGRPCICRIGTWQCHSFGWSRPFRSHGYNRRQSYRTTLGATLCSTVGGRERSPRRFSRPCLSLRDQGPAPARQRPWQRRGIEAGA